MAYIYLMRESNLPEAVVKLICEYTGTRKKWTRANFKAVELDVKLMRGYNGVRIRDRLRDMRLVEMRIPQIQHLENMCEVLMLIKKTDNEEEYYSETLDGLYNALVNNR